MPLNFSYKKESKKYKILIKRLKNYAKNKQTNKSYMKVKYEFESMKSIIQKPNQSIGFIFEMELYMKVKHYIN